jgi:hypothetical protein
LYCQPWSFYSQWVLLDFSYWVSNRRHQKSPIVNDGEPRSISGQMNQEALHCTKLDLALRMIERAVSNGLQAGLFLKRVTVTMSGEPIIIVFVKGYSEPEESMVKGKKKKKEP